MVIPLKEKQMNKEQKRISTPEILFQKMLNRIQSGEWKIGNAIPSERILMVEFGTSRLAIREALSMLRALGVLETNQGQGSIIRNLDTKIIGRLFPLLFSLEGDKTLEHIYQVRLAIESTTASMAAINRNENDLKNIKSTLELLRTQIETDIEASIKTDLEFHIQIARATHNPLFPLLLETIASFVSYVQILSCKDNPQKKHKAMVYHESIFEAIQNQDSERARSEMESHLRSSANRMIKTGIII